MDDRLLGALAEARALGFLGPGPLEAHVASAQAFIDALGAIDGPALDLGTGGGVPGLLLAAHEDRVRWLLVDQHRRRTSFLARVVADLGWVGRVDVVRAAAEELAHHPDHRGAYAVVVARSSGRRRSRRRSLLGSCGRADALPSPSLRSPTARTGRFAPVRSLGFDRVSPDGAPIAVLVASVVPDELPRPWRSLQRRPAWRVSRGTSAG